MMKGNKGEWSELYAFFKLLADGKLFSADQNLNSTKDFVQLKSISRNDSSGDLKFEISSGGIINVIDSTSGKNLVSFSQKNSGKIATDLVNEIQSGKGNSFQINQTLETQIKGLNVGQVKQKSQNKGDIDILIYDPIHAIPSQQKFSIKSFLGSTPTLFNANKTTNIIYKIVDKTGSSMSNKDINVVNSITKGHKYILRVAEILKLGYFIEFNSFQDDTFKLNLQLIDGDLPKIISNIVLDKYLNSRINFTQIINNLNTTNPLNYDLTHGHEFYEFKLINFLVEAALGMTSKSVWSGIYDVIGGIIIVKPNKDILCFHVIDFNKFRQYLKSSAKLDNPSGSKMGYGSVYQKNSETFIKLNFQIKA